MTKLYPEFAALKFEYDAQEVLKEITPYLDQAVPAGAGVAAINKAHTDYWPIASDEEYQNVTHYDRSKADKNGVPPVTVGSTPSWHILSFNYVPDVEGTQYGLRILDRSLAGKWEWRPEFDIPYLRLLIDELPFKRVDVCRFMTIETGGIGPVHVDRGNDDTYEKEGLGSITLLLDNGGVKMQTRINGEIQELEAPCFYFKDSNPHGVPKTTSRRSLLRIYGLIDADKLKALLGEPAIYAV